MVSWDFKAKFLGHSPHIKELMKLAKEQGFSNIESMMLEKVDKNDSSVYYFCVNNRGLKQTKFLGETKGVEQ